MSSATPYRFIYTVARCDRKLRRLRDALVLLNHRGGFRRISQRGGLLFTSGIRDDGTRSSRTLLLHVCTFPPRIDQTPECVGQMAQVSRRTVESGERQSKAQPGVKAFISRGRHHSEEEAARRGGPRVFPPSGTPLNRSTGREKTFGTHQHAPQEPPRAESISRRETLACADLDLVI